MTVKYTSRIRWYKMVLPANQASMIASRQSRMVQFLVVLALIPLLSALFFGLSSTVSSSSISQALYNSHIALAVFAFLGPGLILVFIGHILSRKNTCKLRLRHGKESVYVHVIQDSELDLKRLQQIFEQEDIQGRDAIDLIEPIYNDCRSEIIDSFAKSFLLLMIVFVFSSYLGNWMALPLTVIPILRVGFTNMKVRIFDRRVDENIVDFKRLYNKGDLNGVIELGKKLDDDNLGHKSLLILLMVSVIEIDFKSYARFSKLLRIRKPKYSEELDFTLERLHYFHDLSKGTAGRVGY